MSKLFYVIGASGAGKDTLMNYARTLLTHPNMVIFAHRYITRPVFTGNENHIYLTKEEFTARVSAGVFALHWESHGQLYGIGTEINLWLEKGFNVIVNGSRQYLPEAKQLFPEITAILINASPEVIAGRLSDRGRETTVEISKRLARTSEINADLSNCIEIQNNGTVEDAGAILLNIIKAVE